ncbi:MAG: DNA-binding protein [Betaproteobacteria bacterium HGW-Betaproteobacteria-18]|jgi:hypothetical protein|nr:MAG: DNA-binding protein [Betaproteobacteria bacterium HGW-Betaproteobacteria-5]PKO40569.1 MAG: DNA-binding protein [Betaproteobacteria bacterium HGW-Betaproteobacteria-6]PKO63052.1 MAG: DNA-binding protein [Betaproteobacteria bacterium HGW-Betaproteobacteria-18]
MTRKLPSITPDNVNFWHDGAKGQLTIHYCQQCPRFFHPPAPICPRCTSFAVEPRRVSGKGHVASYTINYQAWRPDLTTPYVVAIVELEEQAGLRFVSNIVDIPPEEVRINMAVKVRFEQHEDVWLPLFEKDE